MPYIRQSDRYHIVVKEKPNYPKINIDEVKSAGDIQYAIAYMLKNYMERKGLNYQNCNDVMGALAGAQMEFYRKVVAPYEDLKIEENGDV